MIKKHLKKSRKIFISNFVTFDSNSRIGTRGRHWILAELESKPDPSKDFALLPPPDIPPALQFNCDGSLSNDLTCF